MRALKPGMTEFQVAAGLAGRVLGRGIVPQVLLVGADERLSNFRHPIPTDRKVEKIVMLVLCGERWGLIVSLTRIVHFGELPEELKRKHHACCQVDAEMIAASRPGVRVADPRDLPWRIRSARVPFHPLLSLRIWPANRSILPGGFVWCSPPSAVFAR